jgi:hypothetical protein
MEAKLALLSFSCSRRRLWLVVEGWVKNISARPLENIFAVAQFYTREDNLVKFDYALVQHDLFSPGQVSPYLITSTDNPEVCSCDIHFKTLFGGHIPFRDDRPGDVQDNLSQTRTGRQIDE